MGDVREEWVVLAGSSHPELASSLAQSLGSRLVHRTLDRFPDGEQRVQLRDDVRDREVYVVQSLIAPIGDHLLELLLLADACRRGGAKQVTGVIPYLAYARQDRREVEGMPLGARVVADALGGALDRLISVDLHSAGVEGCFSLPVEHVSCAALLADAVRPGSAEAVVVSPDLGGAKRAERFARALGLPVAIIHKSRRSGSEVSVQGVVGEVEGRAAIIVDDIVSTAGTIEAAVGALLGAGATKDITVCATHGLFVGPAGDRLRPLPIRRIVVTDTLPRSPSAPAITEVISTAALVAETIRKLHGAK